ncbi:MAG: FkbM family methyltransferase [Bacteroidetes bacterium]|nr:FkbM family methyltransferase [Bacteroidota bacterium]
MAIQQLLQEWYIKFMRYALGRKFLPVMDGPLKGYAWPTDRSYAYLTSNYESVETIQQFCALCKPDTVFYDLGSNIGYFSFIANTLISNGKIYAVEPLPMNYDVFKQLLVLNDKRMQHHNIQLLPMGIADAEKELLFTNDAARAEGNNYLHYKKANSANTITVPCDSIDGLVAKGYTPPTFIKIDVEGAELDVLKGAEQTLKKYQPYLLVATHDCVVPGIKQECINYLEQLGYTLQHTGNHNKMIEGLDDYFAVPNSH